jgi:hypothetical protein
MAAGARLGVFTFRRRGVSKVRSDATHEALRSESVDERFPHAQAGLTAWVSGWYRLKE